MTEPIIEISDLPTGERKVAFDIPGGTCTPQEFATATERCTNRLAGNRIVLITGRGPIWGYAMLAHGAHATPAVATFDPRFLGYVVVATHDNRYRMGQIIPDPEHG